MLSRTVDSVWHRGVFYAARQIVLPAQEDGDDDNDKGQGRALRDAWRACVLACDSPTSSGGDGKGTDERTISARVECERTGHSPRQRVRSERRRGRGKQREKRLHLSRDESCRAARSKGPKRARQTENESDCTLHIARGVDCRPRSRDERFAGSPNVITRDVKRSGQVVPIKERRIVTLGSESTGGKKGGGAALIPL